MAVKNTFMSQFSEVLSGIERQLESQYNKQARDYLKSENIILKEQVSEIVEPAKEVFLQSFSGFQTGYIKHYKKPAEPTQSKENLNISYRSRIIRSGGKFTLKIRIEFKVLDDSGNPHPIWHFRNNGVRGTYFPTNTPIFHHRSKRGNPSIISNPESKFSDQTYQFKQGMYRKPIEGKKYNAHAERELIKNLPSGWKVVKSDVQDVDPRVRGD